MMKSDRELHELDEEGNGESEEKTESRRRRRNQRDDDDVVLDEAFRILSDLVRLNNGAEMPQPKDDEWGWWQ